MSTDPTQYPLTPDQLEKLHALSERVGKTESEILDDLLANARIHPLASLVTEGHHSSESLRDRLAREGILGSFSGPGDLSTNPKYMEGFGEPKYCSDSD